MRVFHLVALLATAALVLMWLAGCQHDDKNKLPVIHGVAGVDANIDHVRIAIGASNNGQIGSLKIVSSAALSRPPGVSKNVPFALAVPPPTWSTERRAIVLYAGYDYETILTNNMFYASCPDYLQYNSALGRWTAWSSIWGTVWEDATTHSFVIENPLRSKDRDALFKEINTAVAASN